jgi:hypothetical protein
VADVSIADANLYLSRQEAAETCQQRGLRHVTVKHLADLADTGKGPPYSRMGKYAYYARADLDAWVAASLRPASRSQPKPKAKKKPARARSAAR